MFKKEHIEYLRDVFSENMNEIGWELLEFNGEADHVRLLITYSPKQSIAVIVNILKGRISRLIRRDMDDIKEMYYRKAGLWHMSYFTDSID